MNLPTVFPYQEVSQLINYIKTKSIPDKLSFIDSCYTVLGYSLYESFNNNQNVKLNNQNVNLPNDQDCANELTNLLKTTGQSNQQTNRFHVPPWLGPLVIKILQDVIAGVV
jgi:hypothetical protein